MREIMLEKLHQINVEREQRLVEKVLGEAARGELAVSGLDQTLHLVSQGRVDTLLVSDGYQMPGFRHKTTDYLFASTNNNLFDVEQLGPVADVVDEAINRTLEQGGHVEVIGDNPQMDDIGGIAALLRY